MSDRPLRLIALLWVGLGLFLVAVSSRDLITSRLTAAGSDLLVVGFGLAAIASGLGQLRRQSWPRKGLAACALVLGVYCVALALFGPEGMGWEKVLIGAVGLVVSGATIMVLSIYRCEGTRGTAS